ncbi:hypothetical protein [Streptomyces sp. NPDC047079]|uniref:hypothetical protein n=1 Tax=Streptomyces sp. NPDC047079 TaxID=3154607 RepID=UPI0033C45200
MESPLHRSVPEDPRPVIPSIPELLAAVLTPFSALSAVPTPTTCPPRASAGPDEEI